MSPYQIQLLTLATQLSKLLKVIAHSDPSAREMKKPLYEKYKGAVDDFYHSVREEATWGVIKEAIDALPKLKQFQVEADAVRVILDKLTKDLEEKFVTKLELSELTRPAPGIRPPKKPKPKIKPKPAPTDAELLIKLAQMDQRQQMATASLQKAIAAINKISPEFFEKKILSNLDPKELEPNG
ncbi:MAG: hypothetical protein A2527_03485 [Candidatus Lambdaproteobacteria bacterium RIFOXYD2_FULL_50_16]|uniref:Uncharacterized protein n=1 Tax=Candidatus Lambdaproteobacteria bacterium RIFOXYD2_FULL_50_16 TaxID=1817772 RepID=A0A1F6GEU3_9PROT|nr:MAG: hypothetical protein A2527_03485 [Candidatus Lambdaproteobacteria bacterium RIFOXYD2_FULL_50_16]